MTGEVMRTMSDLPRPYVYSAEVERVIDGDSLVVTLDLFDRIHAHGVQIRLHGYNAPETRGREREMGKRAAAELEDILRWSASAGLLLVETVERDKYGRWLSRVWLGDTELVPHLIREGWGVEWDGTGKRPKFHPNEPYPLPMAAAV